MEENSNQNEQEDKKNYSPKCCGKSKFLVWVILAILLVSIIALGYYVFQMQKTNDELSMANETLEQSKNTMQKKVSELEAAGTEINAEEDFGDVKQSKFEEMLSKIMQLDRANPYDDKCGSLDKESGQKVEVDCVQGKVQQWNISSLFFTKDLTFVLIGGNYGGSGFKMVKYDAQNDTMEIAEREDAHGGKDTSWYKITDEKMNAAPDQKKDVYLWFAPPDKIISFDGRTMKLTGTSGDAGCWGTSFFDYDVEKNYINITKQCSECTDKAEECTTF